MKNHDTRRSAQAAFTIVEIVIVVTVLLILVSITAIGYRAIVQDSHKETVKTDAQAAAAVLVEEYNRKGAYPATFDGLVVKGATSSFQYSYNSTDDTYCLTASVEGASAYVRSDSMRPTEGGCEGHGVNGEEAVVNMITNPSATATAGYSAVGAAGSNSIITSAASSHSGSTYLRRAITGAGGGGLYFGNTGAVTVGQSYAGSAHVRASKAVNMRMAIEWKQAGVGILSYSHGSVAPVSSAGWTRISATGTAPANAEYATITMYINGSTWAAGDTLDVDSVMFTKGSTLHPYADGSTPGWIWNGAQNASTSQGPALK